MKTRLFSHLDGLKEFKQGKTTFLSFDDDLCDIMNIIYEWDFDDNAFVLSKAAEILRKSLLDRELSSPDKPSQNDIVPQILTSFGDMLL